MSNDNNQQTSDPKPRVPTILPDTKVDMFSMQGFALAQRVATAFASSDAVPTQYRAFVTKKVNGVDHVVENPSAVGNCLVAIEVAQAVGMSITAVMQNSDVIEGKLRWSGKFVIAAINASRRFSPLRFDIKNFGNISASYKEKTGWDNNARKPIFTERTVEIENLQCIAWALPAGMAFPAGIYTLEQARTANLPVIESAPVTMKLAVEEGWYGKAGSKWQTDLKFLMLQYRAGTFFGNIHAPDIVMGMGKTVEEVHDIVDLERKEDGSFGVAQEEKPSNGTILNNLNEAIKAEQEKAKNVPVTESEKPKENSELSNWIEDIKNAPNVEGVAFKFDAASKIFVADADAMAQLMIIKQEREKELKPKGKKLFAKSEGEAA